MIKKFDAFVNESTENKGKGPGNQDLLPSAPKKQTINRSRPTMDFLRIGKQIQTKNIDGFIDSIQNDGIYITDRISGETIKYTLKEVIREFSKVKEEKHSTTVQGFEGTPSWATKQKIYEKKIYRLKKDFGKYKKDRKFDDSKNLAAMEPPGGLSDGRTDIRFDDKEWFDVIKHNDNYDYNDSEKYEIIRDAYGIDRDDESFEPDTDADQDDPVEIELGDDEEEDNDDMDIDTDDGTKTDNCGTEDNPEGKNDGSKREMPNESWVKYWENFNKKQIKLVTEDLEEEIDEEDEVKIIRGTEDNPLPDKKRPIIESYE